MGGVKQFKSSTFILTVYYQVFDHEERDQFGFFKIKYPRVSRQSVSLHKKRRQKSVLCVFLTSRYVFFVGWTSIKKGKMSESRDGWERSRNNMTKLETIFYVSKSLFETTKNMFKYHNTIFLLYSIEYIIKLSSVQGSNLILDVL